ncbi:hypothetical protein PRIPAC_91587 [Pristionchus pacificus]|uniref:methylated diphthine methylhydrolase n=1 Tax=Pristionchus pacificus TaxID=54126 RepID=A0A8R1Z8L0_PRIPA|nr:hypothetical protein PRIPAC_91587 [Pristionchus pacificus]
MAEEQQQAFLAAVAALQQQAQQAALAQQQQQALNLSAQLQAQQLQQQQLPATFPNFNLPAVEKIGGPKYRQLLKTIEEIGKDLKPIYCNNKITTERYKRSLIHLRNLIRDCQSEVEKERVSQNQKLTAELAKLDKDHSSSRSGSLHVIEDYSNPSISTREIPTEGGVFRFTFLPDQSQLIAALTTGRLALISLEDYSITQSDVISDTMLLDVSPSPVPASTTVLSSTNQGSLILYDIDRMDTVLRWDAHSLPWTNEPCEVWTCEMVDDTVVCSGGEDTVLKVWDTRSTERPSSQIKVFDAGVTFIESIGDNKLLTGSYDELLRVIDMRAPKTPLHQVKCGGGVWHLEKCNGGWIASCMYGGWIIIDEQFNPIAQDSGAGKTLLYGSGLAPDGKTMAYCTFNDYTLTVSHLDDNRTWPEIYPIPA